MMDPINQRAFERAYERCEDCGEDVCGAECPSQQGDTEMTDVLRLRNALCGEGVDLAQATGAAKLIGGFKTREMRTSVVALLLPGGNSAAREKRARELLRAHGFEARPEGEV